MNKNWEIVELHGLWWAYKGELPPPEAFQTHGRPRHLPILGPYPSRVIAEALLRKQLDRRDPKAVPTSTPLAAERGRPQLIKNPEAPAVRWEEEERR